nr:disease resistance RPP13-like protein 4 [Quercus suber]POE70289.1 disease resistance rpp13-like protein 4 [Quercus suber]
MEIQLEKLRKDIEYIRLAFTDFTNFEDNAAALFKALLQQTLDKSLNDLRATSRRPTFLIKQLQSKLQLLSEIVLKLKLQIPLPHKLSATDSDARKYTRVGVGADYDDLQVIDELPDLHFHPLFDKSFAFKDFRHVYDSLDVRTKLCLLCFALIPENEVVKKRFLVYWWVGEGLINSPLGSEEKTYEEMGDEIFEKLVKMGCVEAVNKKHRKVADSYKMNPFIRSAMIEFAKDAGFFDFDKKGNPTADFSKCYRACLVLNHPSQKLLRIGSELDQEKLQTIFNVNEPYPDFFELEWFSKLKNVKVLYLGRWQNSAKHHIEVESSEFLNGLRSMKFLRFFSLQGISRITKLPDSVCKLSSLRILDLRACHNLEELPDGIGSLKQLTHLDISECYLLEYIPKGIALLSELLVFKGFVVGDRVSADSCALGELLELRKLRKLSIYTNKMTFPTDGEVNTLQQFKKLQKLTIVWGGGVDSHAKQDKGATQPTGATTMSPKKSGDKKKQDKGVAQPIAAIITSPKKSGDNNKQNKGVAQPNAATNTSPRKNGDNKKQDKGVAQPMVATITSPKNSGDYIRPDKGAEQPIAESTMNPEHSGDKKKKDKGKAELTLESGTKPHFARKLLKVATFKQGTKPVNLEEFKELEKLDLQCYPKMTAPSWLIPGKLDKLKKLYIRGGELQNLIQENDKWKVEILRLKFLSNIKMDWRELRALFPHLYYLEKFKCPKITLFPCDENGLWVKP